MSSKCIYLFILLWIHLIILTGKQHKPDESFAVYSDVKMKTAGTVVLEVCEMCHMLTFTLHYKLWLNMYSINLSHHGLLLHRHNTTES